MSNQKENLGLEERDFNASSKPNKAIMGYRVVISVLIVVLVGLSALYYNIHNEQKAEYALLSQGRDSIQREMSLLAVDYKNLESTNEGLNASIEAERQRVDSLAAKIKAERNLNYAKIKQYEKEVGTLRSVMRGYLAQIDSLNTLNKQLIDENVSFRQEISNQQLRAAQAEERANELDSQIRKGSVIAATGISLTSLNSRAREVSRIKSAEKVRVDFALAANTLAKPGVREVYMRLISPDGYILTSDALPTFEYAGEKLTYSDSREVDYQNEDIEASIFYAGTGFTAGVYTVELFVDGLLAGDRKIDMK
ncbi:MAG: hypothetical protein SNH88_07500 [Rikenellaceae bacterium]